MIYRQIGKRLIDIVAASISITVLSPLLLAVALAIWMTDPGPVIFRQVRAGRNARPFLFYKFRSMPVDTRDLPSDELGEIKLSKVGRFIRRTNLDELPQLVNILRGDMSLVGPRPPLCTQEDLIAARRSNGALEISPGLTGWAQINSFDGMTVAEKASLDGEYVLKLSLIFDIRILLSTLIYLRKPPPTY